MSNVGTTTNPNIPVDTGANPTDTPSSAVQLSPADLAQLAQIQGPQTTRTLMDRAFVINDSPYADTQMMPYQTNPDGTVDSRYMREIQDQFRQMARNPNQLAQLQQQLYQAGYYKSLLASNEQPSYGLLGYDDTRAFSYAMQDSFLSGQPLMDAIKQRAQTVNYAQKLRSASAPTIHLTDASTIATLADQVSQKLVGRKATPEEIQSYIAAVHGKEEGRGSVSPADVVQQQLQQQAPTEVAGHNVADEFDIFRSLLGAQH